jgi:hypothetical protein
MKYSINSYVKKNDKIIKIIDRESIGQYNIYYFSDGTSNEESKFNIIDDNEVLYTAFKKVKEHFTKINPNQPSFIKERKEFYEWLEKEKIKKTDETLFEKIKRIFF